jgi:hypothetical protein
MSLVGVIKVSRWVTLIVHLYVIEDINWRCDKGHD